MTNPPIIAFFNNKGGVGKTSLAYHLAWMFSERGRKILAADLDPQANLSAAFLEEERLEALWSGPGPRGTLAAALKPLREGTGGLEAVHVEHIADRLGLVVGDLSLAAFEDELSGEWSRCLDGQPRAFRIISALWQVIVTAARERDDDLILIDVGPNLGALNRSALVASDHVLIPLAPDLFSLQGLRNLGPTLRRWREEWRDRVSRNPEPQTLRLPRGSMQPLGYVVLLHGVRLDRPVKAYARWIEQIPSTYREAVADVDGDFVPSPQQDPHCLAMLRHYHSLIPLGHEARKPIFALKPADGAIGAHQQAVTAAHGDFETLAQRIERELAVPAPA
ncbi:MAG: AAA family ATPase [Solirubrobacterales bacterium]|nr:AAA family ATPase [Solirubrobacterales bacterium]